MMVLVSFELLSTSAPGIYRSICTQTYVILQISHGRRAGNLMYPCCLCRGNLPPPATNNLQLFSSLIFADDLRPSPPKLVPSYSNSSIVVPCVLFLVCGCTFLAPGALCFPVHCTLMSLFGREITHLVIESIIGWAHCGAASSRQDFSAG
jgi:hypothetical protein